MVSKIPRSQLLPTPQMLSEGSIVMVNPGIVQEADRRILLDHRVEAVMKQGDHGAAMELAISASVEPVRRSSMDEEMPSTSDERHGSRSRCMLVQINS